MKITIVHMEIELLSHGFQFANFFTVITQITTEITISLECLQKSTDNSTIYFYRNLRKKSLVLACSTNFDAGFFHIFPPTQSCQAVGYFNFTVWGLRFSPM
jgi:hypothetical protein